MFKIGYDKKITMVQGDTGVIRMRISNYELSQGDEVRFAIANKANPSILLCQHSDKKIVLEKQVTAFEKDGSARIAIYPYDTEYLQPGKYLYEIQVKTKDGRIDTVVPLTSFTLMDGSIQGEFGQTTPSRPEPTPSEIELRFKRLENEIIPELGDRITNVENEIDSVSSSLDNMMVNIKLYGAIGKDNIDDTRAIQDCIDKVAEHGGYVYIPSGCFMVSQLILKSNVIIKGSGYKSQLKQIGNTHANMIILENPTTHTCGLENLYINGNHGEQTVANDGINFINSSQEIGYEQLIDHYITLRDVHIEKFKGNGLVMKYGREIVLDNVTVRQCGSTGIYLNISDSKISNCTVSTSKIGYHFDMSGNLRVANSKAFVCDTGFMVNSYGASCNLLTNTETQSCLTGYYFKNVIGVNLNNFVSDSEDNGIILENAENCYINGIINSKAEWGGNNKVGIRNKGKLRNTHININRYFNTRSGYVDLVDEYNEVIPSSTIKVNNQEIYNINCFSFSHFESVKNKCFNTMEMLKSNENINLDISYKQGSTKLEISSNPQMDNWGSVELIEKEFRPIIKGCKISLCADFDVIGDLIPTVNIQLFGDDGYSRGKIQGYLLDNNKTAYICAIPQDLPTDATKFKISVGYNFPQTIEQNKAIGWGGKISNIQCTVY